MTKPEMASPSDSEPEHGMAQDRQQAFNQPVTASRAVTKPIPKAQMQHPREFQLGQIRRRFSPKETKSNAATLLKFNLTPSDPDFPFEMSALECILSIPATYPKDKPSLKVGNKDIPRGFAINVEAGFESLVESKPEITLLDLMKALDKNLEAFLSAPKAETVKLVPNKDTRHISATPVRSVEPTIPGFISQDGIADSKPAADQLEQRSEKPARVFTAHEIAEAATKRGSETRQLEARMGRLPFYKKSGDSIAYTLQIEPKKRPELPTSLQAVKTVQMFVPLLYPLEPCRVQLDGIDSEEARAVSAGFLIQASKGFSLMSSLNYLAQNMHTLAKTPLEPKQVAKPVASSTPLEPAAPKEKGKGIEGLQDPDRSHIQYISRPPEWDIIEHGEISGTDSDDLYSYDSEDMSSDEGGGVKVEPQEQQDLRLKPNENQERGTSMSFPFIELYGIELLEISILNITVKCERCREVTEIKGLKSGLVKAESCRKCASPLSIRFRKDLIHANAVRAGFLDLEGCIVGDMLLSTFIPTCSQCSTAYPAPGITSVQGETTTNVCRECHQKFTFKIPSTKFLRISTTTRAPPTSGPRRKKETLGITPGTELPRRGKCRHYSKSYRWFRFSCCEKVYACDKCHDEAEEHVNEWANRMICGFCSREQNYRPEDCGTCRMSLVGKKGTGGFWEGGKGTRDRVRMSRKDKRKHRRIGGVE